MKFGRFRIFFLFMILLLGTQCKSTRPVQSGFYSEKELIIDYDMELPEETDSHVEIYDVSIHDGKLYIYVRYRAGEVLDDFELFTNGLLTKTYPPMVPLVLKRNPSGTKGEKTVMEELIFDVSKARQWSDDQIIFRLLGYPNVIIYRISK
ncbi:MAG TPA: hypothetical protein ENN63_03800 [Bacteroidetes bacterium]|nr:hypothetical protein [Bacteroidota bacterium]